MINKRKGHFMIVVLWVAYVIFAMNWVAGSTLSLQITHYFFHGTVSPIITQVVNYSITTARVFANILAALILMKLGPKKAAGTAIGLLMMSLIAIYLPNYWAYTVARMFMGLGGSMVIVYMNPVVSHYISDQKEKLRINAWNVLSYNMGTFFVAVLFILFMKQLSYDWRLTMTVFASLTLIVFVLWVLKAESFETKASSEGQLVKYGYKDAIKDATLWRYSIGFSGFLTLYMLALVSLVPVFKEYTKLNGTIVMLAVSAAGIVGTFIGIKIGNLGTRRKPILFTSGVMMIGSFALTVFLANISPITCYVFAAISGLFMYIQYPIYMNLPHEMKGMSPQKLTVIFGQFWAIAYAVETIITIIWSYILGVAGYTSSMVFFIACACLYLIFAITLPETKPKKENSPLYSKNIS